MIMKITLIVVLKTYVLIIYFHGIVVISFILFYNFFIRFTKEYAPMLNLYLDHTEKNNLWKAEHDGSLAYSVNFCSRSRKFTYL